MGPRASGGYTGRVKTRQKTLLRLFQRLSRSDFESRTWIEIALGLTALLILVILYKALLGPQIEFASDRMALTNLRESWSQAAAGFGLGTNPNPRVDFFSEYRHFRTHPSIQVLLKSDPQFAILASKANAAFSRLEASDLRAERNYFQSAAAFDSNLFLMAVRVDDYAKDQLDAFRRSFIAIGAGIAVATVGFILLESRLRASSAGEARNRALSRALIAAQEGERLRISHDLHDAIAQDLAAAKLYCGLCEGPDAKQAALLLNHAIDEVRNLCYGLRPAELDRLGIAEATANLCSEMGRDTDIKVNLTIEGLASLDLEPETEINLYRILQEALTNVRRHADAKHVRVVLFGFGDYIELTVDDDGRGPRGAKPGLGRTGMEERAKMIGGRFYFGFGPWGGSSLRVTVPTRRKEAS